MAEHTYNVVKAVYDTLTSDTAIIAIVPAVRIFSGVADTDIDYPYIIISRIESEPWDTKDVEGEKFFIQINFYSRAGGIVEAVNLKEAIYEALHRQTGITMSAGTTLVDIVHDTLSGLNVQEDGITVEGVLRFALTIQ